MFLKDVLKTKTVSVWGLGYLGYTTMLKLQDRGFSAVVYDINKKQLELFSNKKYPTADQVASWSQMGYIPKLDYRKIKLADNPKELFRSSCAHFITVPEYTSGKDRQNTVSRLAAIFAKSLKNSRITPLVIFESASIPGHIEKYFVGPLKEQGLVCSRDYYLGVMFRTDWSVEAFIKQKDKMPIGGYCAKSLEAMRELFGYLDIPAVELASLKEAEIYANSIGVIQAMVGDFIRQLALGYPPVNVKRLSGLLFKNMTLEDCAMNIGTGGTRMTFAVDNLIQGADIPGKMTLLKEFQGVNISSVLNYGEYITKHGYKSVAILGVTYKGNQKDLTLSPAITLADYLVRNSVKVLLNDPFFDKDEIRGLVKGVAVAGFPEEVFLSDVVIVASDHNEYKYLSQAMLDGLKKKTRLVIDNHGIWSRLNFGGKIKYHQVGDGTLNLSK